MTTKKVTLIMTGLEADVLMLALHTLVIERVPLVAGDPQVTGPAVHRLRRRVAKLIAP
jgi:hypothetical protein